MKLLKCLRSIKKNLSSQIVEESDNVLNIEERTNLCKKCPICDLDNWVCNAKLYLNPDTNDVSDEPKEGYIKGCGCLLNRKIPNSSKHCPVGKW